MKLNKTIEEEALRYVCKILKDTDYKDAEVHLEYAFRDGANFILSKWQDALRWRKVEEELPSNDNRLLVKVNTNELAFARYKNDKFIISDNCFGRRVVKWLLIPR